MQGICRADPGRAIGRVRRRPILLWFAGDADPLLDEIESFVTGEAQRQAIEPRSVDGAVHRHRRIHPARNANGRRGVGESPCRPRPLDRPAHHRWRAIVVKSTGDGVLATFDGPARAIECAGCAIRDAVEELGLSIRVGLHTGEMEKADGDVHGIAVHIAARIMALAGAREVFVSGVIPPLVLGSRLNIRRSWGTRAEGRAREAWRVLAVDSNANRRKGTRNSPCRGTFASVWQIVVGGQRQPHLEPCAGTHVVRRQRAAVGLHQTCRDRQSDPDPLGSDESARGTRSLEPRYAT